MNITITSKNSNENNQSVFYIAWHIWSVQEVTITLPNLKCGSACPHRVLLVYCKTPMWCVNTLFVSCTCLRGIFKDLETMSCDVHKWTVVHRQKFTWTWLWTQVFQLSSTMLCKFVWLKGLPHITFRFNTIPNTNGMHINIHIAD